MKHLIIILSFFHCLLAQQNYDEKVNIAQKEFELKNYDKSAQLYSSAFNTLNLTPAPINLNNDRYNAACAWALANNKDESFKLLQILTEEHILTNIEWLIADKNLSSLHFDKRWKKLLKNVKLAYENIKPVSKAELKKIYADYKKAQDKVFGKGATHADVDKLYSFYTADFEYHHPTYGSTYTRKKLYSNTVKFAKEGRFDKIKKRTTLNIIYGQNGIAIEQQYEGDDKTTMTLFKFRKGKIYYVHEFW